MCWNGNTIHWGSRASKKCPQPRMSFAVAFRRRSARLSHLESSCLESMTREDVLALTLSSRVRLIAKGMLLFKWWFKLDSDVLPEAFLQHIVKN